ncbi:hypothetical protein BKG94_05300 [Rodentibacter ratti]|uniref:hypothetical protein n=1 Tax=Rodentibacter ratti TaxID=1906745 RepID=UPI000987B561|nr:hypothetical protein [Rodentibacter ratti]OOF88558.1 hypothetical protein BKG94_05300 [Rodentibacter ratti]
MTKWKKVFAFIPLFLWTVMVLFLYFYMVIANGDKHDGEAYIAYFLLLFYLTFPFGSFVFVVFSLFGFGGNSSFNPVVAGLMGIVAIGAFYFQWYVLYPKLRNIILRKWFKENHFIFDFLFFIAMFYLILSIFFGVII